MMSSINDLLRAADDADAKRFPLIHPSELELWCSYPAWTVAETVALSIMRDPHVISPEIIKRLGLILHPHGVSPQDWKRLSRIAGLYEARRIPLLRAARHDPELRATPVDGDFEIRPPDFLAWEKPRRGQGPWSGLTDALVEHVKAFHPEAATAPAAATEARAAPFAPAGANTPASARLDWITEEMRKRPRKKRDELLTCLMAEFGITKSEAEQDLREAAKAARCAGGSTDWYRRGRPHKSARS